MSTLLLKKKKSHPESKLAWPAPLEGKAGPAESCQLAQESPAGTGAGIMDLLLLFWGTWTLFFLLELSGNLAY